VKILFSGHNPAHCIRRRPCRNRDDETIVCTALIVLPR
jgi:hypothetical protein